MEWWGKVRHNCQQTSLVITRLGGQQNTKHLKQHHSKKDSITTQKHMSVQHLIVNQSKLTSTASVPLSIKSIFVSTPKVLSPESTKSKVQAQKWLKLPRAMVLELNTISICQFSFSLTELAHNRITQKKFKHIKPIVNIIWLISTKINYKVQVLSVVIFMSPIGSRNKVKITSV